MPKAGKPTVPLTGRVAARVRPDESEATRVDKQTMIQAALNQCNTAIAAIVTEQLTIRKDVTPATADTSRTHYGELERLRRHVLQQRHQIQVASFSLEGLSVDRLAQQLSAIMVPLEG